MNADAVLTALLELLGLSGWRVCHIPGTARELVIGADGDGFPDIVALHPSGRMLVMVCLPDLGIPTPAQLAWIFGFRSLAIEATIIRPGTYDGALGWIRGIGPMPDARVVMA